MPLGWRCASADTGFSLRGFRHSTMQLENPLMKRVARSRPTMRWSIGFTRRTQLSGHPFAAEGPAPDQRGPLHLRRRFLPGSINAVPMPCVTRHELWPFLASAAFSGRMRRALAPHALERFRRHDGVAYHDAGVAQEVLQPACVYSFRRQGIPSRMPQHVNVNRKRQVGDLATPLDHASDAH